MTTTRGWRQLFIWLWVVVTVACTTQTPASTTTPSTAPATLVVWHALSSTTEYVVTERIQHIAEQSGFVVVIQKMPATTIVRDILTAWPQARGAHVVILSNAQLAQLASAELALPLDNLIDTNNRSALADNVLDTVTFVGADQRNHLYGVPVSYALPVLYYNMRNVLSAPRQSDDLFGIAHSLYAPPQWGLGIDLTFDTMVSYLAAFDGQVFSPQGDVVLGSSGRAGSEAWLAWLAGLNADPQMLTKLHAVFTIERALASGNLTMAMDSSAQYVTYQQVWGEATGVVGLPELSLTAGAAQPYLQTTAIALNPRLSDQERVAARQLINELITIESQQQFRDAGIQPVNQLVDVRNTPILQATQQAAAQAVAPPVAMLRADVYTILRTMMTQVMIGTQTPADAVTLADQQLRQLLVESDTP
jgi:maltose-binding protein MalE